MKNDLLADLVAGYERELGLYAQLLGLAEESARDADLPRGVDRTLGALREKGRLLGEIGEIETRLAPLKDEWARGRDGSAAGSVVALNGVLERIARTLETILAIEETGTRRFAVRENVGPVRARLAPAAPAAAYETEGTADRCLSVQG